MKRYLVQRLVALIPTVWGAITVVFFLIHLVPGDPVDVMLGETAGAVDREELRLALGLNRPVLDQYGHFLRGVLHGDLGVSISQQTAVAAVIAARVPATLQLTAGAMIFGVVMSLPLGLLAAANKGSWIDRFALVFSLAGLSMPNFWLGPLFMILFAIQFGWLPVSGIGGLDHLILPALTLGLGMAALLTRIVRASLLQTVAEDYVRTARAKGLSERLVWVKHTLRNALLPAITIVSLQFGSLLAGAVITETIFSWPGIGRLTVQAIQMRDYPLVQGCVLVIAVAYVIVNVLGDLLYRLADPRISYAD
ncbi:MAG TPA: nickel ABC transporter permease [Candidatus Binatia bacterium]